MFSKVPSCAFSGFWTLKLTHHFALIYDIGKFDWNILRNIMKTAQDSHTITIKQIVRFQERMYLEKIEAIKFKMAAYRPLFTSTGLVSRNIIKTAQDSYISLKQIVRFQERMHFEKFQLYQIQNGRLSAIIHLDRPDIEWTVLDSQSITIKQNVRFQERMHVEKFRLDQIQNGCLSAIIHFHMADIW